jgi:hypothetical protein
MEVLKQEASEYVALLDDLRVRLGDTESALAVMDQIGKDRRVRMMGSRDKGLVARSSFPGNEDDPATPKQLGLLRRLGINPPAGLTKRSASTLIDESRGQ